MVAIHLQRPLSANSIDSLSYSIISGPVTPSASDCLSQSCESDGQVAPVQETLSPVKRDPTLLMERLDNCRSYRRMGKRKRRRAMNEASLAALVEGYEEDSKLYVEPFRTAFTDLLECPALMMIWNHFTSLSEEEQRLYLAGHKQRAKLHQLQEQEAAVVKQQSRPDAADCCVTMDARVIHPSALPCDAAAVTAAGQTPVSAATAPAPGHYLHQGGTLTEPVPVCPTSGDARDELIVLPHLLADSEEPYATGTDDDGVNELEAGLNGCRFAPPREPGQHTYSACDADRDIMTLPDGYLVGTSMPEGHLDGGPSCDYINITLESHCSEDKVSLSGCSCSSFEIIDGPDEF